MFLNAAQMLSDWREKIDFVTAKDGVVCVDVEALREYLSTYMIIDDETQELIDRARKLWEELKQLDSDLQNASIEANAKVRLLGNEYDANSLISVSDSENVLFDEKVLSGINGNIHNTIDNPQKGWIVRDLEG